METLNGNDYIIGIDEVTLITAAKGADYETVMCLVSNGFDGTREGISVSNKCSGGWDDSLPGNGSWTMTGEGHAIDETGTPSVVSYQKIMELWKSGKKFWAKIMKEDGTGVLVREGVVWISNVTENAGTNEPYSFSFTLQGTGEPIIIAVA